MVISDSTTMVYSPRSKNIKPGSTSVEKPNAIVLYGHGDATPRVASIANSLVVNLVVKASYRKVWLPN